AVPGEVGTHLRDEPAVADLGQEEAGFRLVRLPGAAGDDLEWTFDQAGRLVHDPAVREGAEVLEASELVGGRGRRRDLGLLLHRLEHAAAAGDNPEAEQRPHDNAGPALE